MTNKNVDMLKDVADSNETQNTSEQATIGSLLKGARKKQGASIDEIAVLLHLRPCIVHDIEADNFDDIASAIYVKGYVKNYARIVQVDAEALQSCIELQFPEASAPEMQSFSRKTTRQASDGRLMFVTYAIAFILLALLVLWWVQKSDTQASVDFSQPTMEEVANSVPELFSTQDLPDPNKERDSGIESTAIEPSGSVTELASVIDAESESDMLDFSVGTQPELIKQAIESVTGESSLSLRLIADCWINVKDADGKTLINDLEKAGSLLEVKGREPFKLTLGAPQAVIIQLNEESISLADYPNGRVARFSLPFSE
ncbi:MAG: cytoskeleton protein RodZ [Shewanella sp.]|jgi:cytoskeleton protein RodZ